MAFALTIDGVPLEDSGISVLFDSGGKARMIKGKIPRLSPEIVAAVRGGVISPSSAAVAIQVDVDAQPAANPFGVAPGQPVRVTDVQLLAVAKPPHVVYRCNLQSTLYTVNALTGAIVDRKRTIES